MSKNFTVSLMLQARNNMSGTLSQVNRDIKALGNNAKSTSQQIKDQNPFYNWGQNAKKAIDEVKGALGGLAVAWAGGKIVSELGELAKKAGEVQMQMIQLGNVYGLNIDSSQLDAIEKQAQDLSQKTLFSKKEILSIDLELAHAGISREALKKVLPEATYLSEVEVGIGKSSSAEQTSYNFARMAEDAGITNDIKRMSKFADDMNRIIGVTHASSQSLGEAFKYSMPVVKNLGWTENDNLMASAMAARAGVEGSMAGTHIKDFAERLNPLKPLKANNQKILSAMEDAGLISGVHTEVSKKGKVTITGFDEAALLKDKNHIKSYGEMVDILSKKHAEFLKSHANSTKYTKMMSKEELATLQESAKLQTGKELSGGELEWAALMNRVFGEQGQDFAIITSHKEMYERLKHQMDQQKSLHQQIDTIRNSFVGQAHIAKGQLETLGLQIGKPLMEWALPPLRLFTNALSKMIDVMQSHPVIAKVAAATALAIGGFTALIGTMVAVPKFFRALKLLSPFAALKNKERGNSIGQRINQALRTNLMTVRATRVYLNGPVSQLGGGKGGGTSILGPDGKPLSKGNKKYKIGKPEMHLPDIPQKQGWKDRLKGMFSKNKTPTTGLEEMSKLSRLAKFGKGLGIVGTVASTGLAAYDLYQQAKQSGWRQAASTHGGAMTGGAIGGFIGGAAGSFLGPIGTMFGAAAGNWIGTKAGEWFDKGGYTKKAVDWAVSMKDKLKNWWNGDEPKRASNDVKQMSTAAQQHTGMTRQQMTQLTAVAGQSANQTKTSLGSISTVTGQGKTWGTIMMSGLIASITSQFPELRSAIAQLQSIMNISAPKIQIPTIQNSGIAAYANDKKGVSTHSFVGVKLYANGGIINSPHWVDGGRGIAGEAGPEAIIPLSYNRRARGLELWHQVGRMLGVRMYANGGFTRSLYAASAVAIGKGSESYYQQQFSWKDALTSTAEIAKEVFEQIHSVGYQSLRMIGEAAKRASLPLNLMSEALEVAEAKSKKQALVNSLTAMGGGSAGAWAGGALGSLFAPGIGTVIGASLGSAAGSILGRFTSEKALSYAKKYMKKEEPKYVRSGQAGHQDNRHISIVIHANDRHEAEKGVRKALDVPDKYIASRKATRPAWIDGGIPT
jgi:TP901 family phage tail tape measure protein